MEAYRKSNRESMRGKFVPFYRNNAPNPSSTMQYTATGIKPNHYSSSPASVGFLVHEDYATTKRDSKVSIVVADCRRYLDQLYGQPADESVDIKAEKYIAMVRSKTFSARANTF